MDWQLTLFFGVFFICFVLGSVVSYTNWKTGYPDESSDKQCSCVSPQCKRENKRCKAEFDRKWLTCNCSKSYAIVCQKRKAYRLSAEIPEVDLFNK